MTEAKPELGLPQEVLFAGSVGSGQLPSTISSALAQLGGTPSVCNAEEVRSLYDFGDLIASRPPAILFVDLLHDIGRGVDPPGIGDALASLSDEASNHDWPLLVADLFPRTDSLAKQNELMSFQEQLYASLAHYPIVLVHLWNALGAAGSEAHNSDYLCTTPAADKHIATAVAEAVAFLRDSVSTQ